ncbi:MAG: YihA family ribosome biogenesis GTP-binding protein [Clostridia bacterium]|nr:YihA family ribosome biogenesis GTP-binding protein [Clostridia bacterium]
MIIKNASFITSAASRTQFLHPNKPMIAVCGKSNVGKSSLINKLAGRNKLAKTSAEPGRTRLVNYFDFGEFMLADLPGYGYAKVSKVEKEKWAKLLDEFFSRKEELAHVFLLVDLRHEPGENDVQMTEYLHYHTIPYSVIATKADKLSKMQQKAAVRTVAAGLKLGEANVIPFSSETGAGKDEVLSKIEGILNLLKEPSEEA